jgi:rhodanese-related sulfurtransferase
MKVFLLCAIAVAACSAQTPAPVANPAYRAIVQEAQAHVKRVDVQQYRALREAHPDLMLVDVRETEEWAKGRAAGAIHISKGLIEHDIEAKAANKDVTIVLYCHSGARSALAAENLQRMGYRNVYSLDGGLTAYQAAGLPMDK